MTSLLPVTGMYHLGVVVPDCRKSIEHFSRIFGIPRWDLQVLTNDSFGRPRVHGRNVRQHFISALAIGGPISFELCQPLPGDCSVYASFLEEKGGGLHHTHASIVTAKAFAALQPEIERNGLRIAQEAVISDTVDYYYYDTQEELGTLAELLVIKGPNPRGGEPEVVRFGHDVTHPPDRMPIDKLYRYAVRTDRSLDVMKANYERIYGIENWFGFESPPEDTKKNFANYAQPFAKGFRTWSGRIGALGVQIVEPRGGAPISADKLSSGGSSMHHIMTTITPRSTFERSLKWLQGEGIYVGQDARSLDGSTHVCFLDARERLDGLYIEVVVPDDDTPEMTGRAADILIGR